MAEQVYRQCALARKVDGGISRYVVWIPDHLAKVGGLIRIKKTGQVWVVKEVGGRETEATLVGRQIYQRKYAERKGAGRRRGIKDKPAYDKGWGTTWGRQPMCSS